MNQPPKSLEAALDDVEARFLYNLPESELSSPERLFYQIEQAYWYYEDFKADVYSHLPHFSTLKSFAVKIFNHCDLLKNMSDRFTEIFADYKSYKTKIPVCGCILLNADMTRFVLVKNYNGNGWTFPRGKINENENELDCAIREVFEETGYNAKDLCNPNDFVISFQGEKKVLLYIVVGVPEDTIFEAHCRKEVSKIEFHSIKNIPSNTYHVHPFMPKLKRWINQKNKSNKVLLTKSPNITGIAVSSKRAKKAGKTSRSGSEGQEPPVPKVLKRLKNKIDEHNNDTFQLNDSGDKQTSSSNKGWSVADMFQANARLTGKDYSYDGNPHAFGASHPRFVNYRAAISRMAGQSNSTTHSVDLDFQRFSAQSHLLHDAVRDLEKQPEDIKKLLEIQLPPSEFDQRKLQPRREIFTKIFPSPFVLDKNDIVEAIKKSLIEFPVTFT